MSLLSWFSRKKPASSSAGRSLGGTSPIEPTQPMELDVLSHAPAAPVAHPRPAARVSENTTLREQLKTQSLGRREHLYAAVRESLLRVGILAASYKFKVLALDQGGRQYMVMIDLAANLSRDAEQMAQIEALIADNAKSHYDLVVTAVYWRVDERLGEVNAHHVVAPAAVTTVATEVPQPQDAAKKGGEHALPGEIAGSRYEPLQTEEMLAFKRALAVTAASPSTAGVVRPPARSYSPLATGYEDTQVVSPETRPPGLGSTQYGDLN